MDVSMSDDNFTKKIFSSLNIFLYVVDLQTQKLVWLLGTLENILGCNLLTEDLKPLELTEKYYHPKDRPLIKERIRLFSTKQIQCWSGVYRIRHKAGHWVWVYSRQSLVNSPDNKQPKQLAGIIMDVTSGLNTDDQLNTLIKEALKFKNGDKIKKLTRRELMVIKLIAKGHSYTRIAKELFIQPDTVNRHRKNILRKLGMNNIATLVCFAKEVGLV
jgi:PAS domain S-box-containing protein